MSGTKKYKAIHTLHVTGEDGAPKRVDPGQEVELSDDDATLAGASIIEAGLSPEEERLLRLGLRRDRPPSIAELRAALHAEVDANVGIEHARLLEKFNAEQGIVLRKPARSPGVDPESVETRRDDAEAKRDEMPPPPARTDAPRGGDSPAPSRKPQRPGSGDAPPPKSE